MVLDQHELDELLALFPNSVQAIERFKNSNATNNALDKLDQKVLQLRKQISELKVKQAKERENFLIDVRQHISPTLSSELSIAGFYGRFGGNLEAAKKAKNEADANPLQSKTLYSRIDILIAKYSLNLDVDDLVNDSDDLIESEEDIKRTLLDAWNKNLDNKDITLLEEQISAIKNLKEDLIQNSGKSVNSGTYSEFTQSEKTEYTY